MTRKVFRGIFIALSFILFIFLVKYFYFDTKMGFNTEILELNYRLLLSHKLMNINLFVSFFMNAKN